MSLARNAFRNVVRAAGLKAQAHVNGSVSVARTLTAEERATPVAAQQVVTSFRQQLTDLYQNREGVTDRLQIVQVATVGPSVVLTVTSLAMQGQSGAGAHNPMVVEQAQSMVPSEARTALREASVQLATAAVAAPEAPVADPIVQAASSGADILAGVALSAVETEALQTREASEL